MNISKGVPFCDYFVPHMQSHIKQSIEFGEDGKAKYKTRITNYMSTVFVKSTMFQGKIDAETKGQSKEFFDERFIPLMEKFVPEENKRFEKILEAMASRSGVSIIVYSAKFPQFTFGKVVLNDIKRKIKELGPMNKILQNQKRMCMFHGTFAIVAFLMIIIIFFGINMK